MEEKKNTEEASQDKLTDFGYAKIPESQKEEQVKEVFDEVAPKYDLLNDVLSVGMHRLWKNHAISQAGLRDGVKVLDIAGGTGDMTIGMIQRVGQGEFWLTDINKNMLEIGRKRVLQHGFKADFAVCDAEKLPFKDDYFDVVTVSFGLRNMTKKDVALKEMLRVCKKGGKVMVLEFSKPAKLLAPLYDFYSFRLMPWIASKFTGHPENYRYLVESIRMHPDQVTLAKIMKEVGMRDVRWENLTFGITALHIGYK